VATSCSIIFTMHFFLSAGIHYITPVQQSPYSYDHAHAHVATAAVVSSC